MPPGATTNDAQSTRLGALHSTAAGATWVKAGAGITARAGATLVALGVGVLRPLPDISGHIEKAPRTRCSRAHRPRRLAPTTSPCAHTHNRIRTRIARLIAPLVARVLWTRCSTLPLGLSRQAATTSRTERGGLIPAHSNGGLCLTEVAAKGHEASACTLTDTRTPLRVRDLMGVDQEGRDTHRLSRTRVRLIVICTARECATRDARHAFWKRRWTGRIGGRGGRLLRGRRHARWHDFTTRHRMRQRRTEQARCRQRECPAELRNARLQSTPRAAMKCPAPGSHAPPSTTIVSPCTYEAAPLVR